MTEVPIPGEAAYDQYLISLAETGLTGRAAIRVLRDEMKFEFSDKVFWDKWRQAQNLMKFEWSIRRMGYEQLVPRSMMDEKDWDMGYNYHILYEVEYWDYEAEQMRTSTRSVGVDELLTKGELEEFGYDLLRTTERLCGWEIREVRVRGVRHQTGAPYLTGRRG